jgi:hypothetical protein
MQCETICSTGEEDWCCITQPFSLHETLHFVLLSMGGWWGENWFGFQAVWHGTQYNQTRFEVFMIFMLESVPIENVQNRMNSRWLLLLTNTIPGWAYIIIGLIPNVWVLAQESHIEPSIFQKKTSVCTGTIVKNKKLLHKYCHGKF